MVHHAPHDPPHFAPSEDPGRLLPLLRGGTRYQQIRKLGVLGDSITNSTSGPVFGNQAYLAAGYSTYIRRRVGARIEVVKNPISGDYDFGIDGAESGWFLGSNATAVSYFEAVLESDADTLLLLLGANDMVQYGGHPGLTGEQSAANIIELSNQAITAGKNMVIVAALPQRSTNADAAQFLARRLAQAAALKAYAASQGAKVQFVDASSAFDSTGDGYLDVSRSIDGVHPNITGAARLGLKIGAAIKSRAKGETFIEIPPPGDPRWVTRNPYAMGTPGPGNTATDWTLSAGVITGRQLIARTDGVPGNWQEMTISGPGFTPPTSGYFANFYTSSAGGYLTGATLMAVMEIELVSGNPLSAELDVLYNAADKTIDCFDNGGISAVTEALPTEASGLMFTPPWASTGSGSDIYARCKAWGNCVVRVGRMGVFVTSVLPVPITVPDLKQWLSAKDAATLLNESSIPVADGGAIARWSDKSGNGNHVTQGLSTARPTYDADGMGGRPTVALNGTQGFSNPYSNPTPAITIFMVVDAVDGTGYRGLISTNGANANQTCVFARISTAPQWGTYDGSPRPFTSVITGGKRIIAVRRSAAGGVRSYVDGVADGAAPGSSGQDGHIGGVLNQQVTGKISEVLVYGRELGDAEMTSIFGYLAAEYP